MSKTNKKSMVWIIIAIIVLVIIAAVCFSWGAQVATRDASKDSVAIPSVATRVDTLRKLSAQSDPVLLSVEDRIKILKSLHVK